MIKERTGGGLSRERPRGAIPLTQYQEGMPGYFFCNADQPHTLERAPGNGKCPVSVEIPGKIVTISFCTKCGKDDPSTQQSGVGPRIHSRCGGEVATQEEYIPGTGYKY